jgi:5-methylcytosine-specific restriction endonuclease McrA
LTTEEEGDITMSKINKKEVESVIAFFEGASFTTFDFAKQFKIQQPLIWDNIEQKYGPGGKGSGRHYSSFSYISQILSGWANKGYIFKNDYEKAPLEWGSPIIRRWASQSEVVSRFFPDEITENVYWEGAIKKVIVNRFERDTFARKKCLEYHKPICKVCNLNFELRYGELGSGFMHVHHIIPISKVGKSYKIDPINDLVPVCPNCHAMLHRKADVIGIEDLRNFLK